MTHIDNLFDDPYLKAASLEGEVRIFIIKNVTQEEVGAKKDLCPVVHFQQCKKGLVLNKTNAKRIKSLYGPEVEGWFGKRIMLYPSETDYAGDTVECIRVKAESPPEPPVEPEEKQVPNPTGEVTEPDPTDGDLYFREAIAQSRDTEWETLADITKLDAAMAKDDNLTDEQKWILLDGGDAASESHTARERIGGEG